MTHDSWALIPLVHLVKMHDAQSYKDIERVWNHPFYTNVSHDIAVIKLKSGLFWNINVSPACLPGKGYVRKYEGPLMVSVEDQ